MTRRPGCRHGARPSDRRPFEIKHIRNRPSSRSCAVNAVDPYPPPPPRSSSSPRSHASAPRARGPMKTNASLGFDTVMAPALISRSTRLSLPHLQGNTADMRRDDGRRRLRHNTRIGDAEPGDERNGDYSRERLLRMDARFCAAMARALARGLERWPDAEPKRRSAG